MGLVRVIVIGAGEVGSSIAENLADSHEVIVVEVDPDVVEELTYSMDVLPIQGDGTDLEILQQAGIEDAEMLVSATDVDEINIVACGTAKTVGDVFTIARVKRRHLLSTWQQTQGAFGVDFMVSSDLLTAEAIFRISGIQGALDVDTFAGGLVRMAEFELTNDGLIIGQSVSEADRWESLTFAAIFRDDEVIIPQGNTILAEGDRVVVIGTNESVAEFAADLTATDDNAGTVDDIVIVGGSEVGFQTAQVFEQHDYRPRLVEEDSERARELAEALPNTTVLQNDATDQRFLKDERIDEADIVVSTLASDERNLLVSMLADRIGVDRTVSIVQTAAYADLFETVGVDVAVNPREETAEEIVRFAREGTTEKIAMLEHDRAEVLEVELTENGVLSGRPIAEAVGNLPAGVVIGSASRGGEVITPRGETTLRSGDHVVLFVEASKVDSVLSSV